MENIISSRQGPSIYIVGTPIGNMQDMSPRAIDILKNCDLILAEDTRHSIYLLKKFNIDTPLRSYHQHNERHRAQEVINLIGEGKVIALISDAGMPVISDPGYTLVNLAYENNYTVSVVPGPCAITAAIAISGIDCSSFCFAGFLHSKSSQRIDKLESLKVLNQALVIYEAPHRLLKCLADISTVFGEDIIISVIKEITKQYETVYYGSVSCILTKLSSLDSIKGEYVIIIDNLGDNKQPQGEADILAALQLLADEKIKLKQAVKIVSKLLQAPKNAVYDIAVRSLIF